MTVDVTAEDDRNLASVEYPLDGENWASLLTETGEVESIGLDEDGIHDLRYRAADADGNVTDGSVTVQVDGTSPEVGVTGIEDDAVHGSSETLEWTIEADDATSGLADTAATIDGEPIEPGTLNLWELELGDHLLEVTTTDAAGHEANIMVEFTVEATTVDLRASVERLAAAGSIDTAEAAQLDAFLDHAERHLAADRLKQAVASLERFADATDDALLLRDVEAVIASLG